MTRLVATAFLRPSDNRVETGPWEILSKGEWSHLGDDIPGWDYATEVTLRRHLTVDVEGIKADCLLPDCSELELGVDLRSSKTGTKLALARENIVPGQQNYLDVTFGGSELGGTLQLSTRILLMDPGKPENRLTPKLRGTILWQDQFSTRLEGSGSLFPIEMIDFESAGLPEESAWYLEWDSSNLNAATMGCLRLFVNKNHQTAVSAFTGSSDSRELILSMAKYDALRTLIDSGLEHPDFDPHADYLPGTVGDTIRTALRLPFSAQAVGSIRGLRDQDPSEYMARIQSSIRFLR